MSRPNVTNNIYPYGNVPLSLLQQQIPADIKVGGGGGNSGNNAIPASSKRPSFYQWPLVGNFFGSNGRARFKSLGGGGGTGRRYEPQGQLTPPSLQNLQQGNAAGNKESSAISRRPFTRPRNSPQQTMSVEDQTKVEYYLLRQQQLHLQQQQLHQANRLLWGDSSRSQQLSSVVRGQQQGLSFQQYQQLLYQQQQQQQQWIPQRQVVPPPPPPPQWRPDALVEAEVTRYAINSKSVVQGELSMPLDHMQQTFAQTLLNPSNQQFIERIRNHQQHQNIHQIRSSMLLPGPELTTTPALMSSLVVANVVPSPSSTIISSSPVTLTTMTISNTLPVPMNHQPEIEQFLASSDNTGVTDMQQSESIQTSYIKSTTEDSGLSLATIEAATLLSAKTPSSNRQMNETVLPATQVSSSTNITTMTSLNSTDGTLDLDESASFNQTISSVNISSSVASNTAKEDVVLPLRDNTNAATILWSESDDPFTSDSGSSTILMTDELYPNPEQLGQARDEYWSNKALTSKGRQINPSSSLPIVGSTYYQHQYAAVRPSRLHLQEHQPLYIPLNPADRQSRQLQAQYYADKSSVHKPGSEPVIVVTTR